MAQIAPLLLNKDLDLVKRCHSYEACHRPGLMYCSETWVQTEAISSSIKKTPRRVIKALRRTKGVTYKDRVTNKAVIKNTGLVDLDKLHLRSRLRWSGHVHRRENEHALKSKDHVSVPGKRPAIRPKNAGSIVLKKSEYFTDCLDRMA